MLHRVVSSVVALTLGLALVVAPGAPLDPGPPGGPPSSSYDPAPTEPETRTVTVDLSDAVLTHHGLWMDGREYHWATTAIPLRLKVIDHTTYSWYRSGALHAAVNNWNNGTNLDTRLFYGETHASFRRSCPFYEGHVRVCNYDHGYPWSSGWATTDIQVTANGHITAARIRINDHDRWTSSDWNRWVVMCHELGHVYGLGHINDDHSSCMNYTYAYAWPGTHDRNQIQAKYSHTHWRHTYDPW